jgi:hypothetical protein
MKTDSLLAKFDRSGYYCLCGSNHGKYAIWSFNDIPQIICEFQLFFQEHCVKSILWSDNSFDIMFCFNGLDQSESVIIVWNLEMKSIKYYIRFELISHSIQ